jgi:hypothetical protein
MADPWVPLARKSPSIASRREYVSGAGVTRLGSGLAVLELKWSLARALVGALCTNEAGFSSLCWWRMFGR